MKRMKLAAPFLALFFLSGCIGASDYSCNGLPDGAMCLSVKETYEMTNSNEYKRSSQKNKEKEDKKKGEPVVLQQHVITEMEQAVRSLDGTHAIPVRVPAQIMRVWYGPYEGLKGQASFMPGVGYVEVEPRKWVFTKPNYKLARQLQPLQVNTSLSSTVRGSDHNAGLNDLKPQLPSQQKGKTTQKEKKK